MNFKTVLEKLLSAFEEKQVQYALIGGFAMGLWGGIRSTVDLDFLVRREDMPKVHEIMTAMGYESYHHSENVSQYIAPINALGGVDFLHAFRNASMEMLARAKELDIFDGALKVRTLIPEDIIGFKLQAIYNNPEREKTDSADIEWLLSVHGKSMDWPLLEQYFSLFEMEGWFSEVRQRWMK